MIGMDHVTTAQELTARALALGIEIPCAPSPKGAYLPALEHHGLIYTSGMGTMVGGVRHHIGYVGAEVSIEQAREAAAIATVNALAAAIAKADGIENIERVLRLTGYVRSARGFTEQTQVVDGGSVALTGLLGEAGTHVRSAIGVSELPYGIPVEVELIVVRREEGQSSNHSVR